MATKPVITSVASQALGTGALTHEITVAYDEVELVAVMLHAGSAISQVVTVTHVGTESSTNYAFVLKTETLSSATDFVYRPTEAVNPIFKRGDKIKFTCANSGTPAITVYSKIQYRETN